MNQMYDELADWWPLLSDPDDYAEEAVFFLSLMARVTGGRAASLLELGSGGGNNALHMKRAFASVTLVDLSPKMLAVSAALNPDCDHEQGDMRTVRLGRTFDVVFIHDAIDYMVTPEDLKQAIETAYVHCAPGGLAVLVPDHDEDTFEPSTEHGGHDGESRSLRYLEWTTRPDDDSATAVTDYVFLLHENGQPPRVIHERHVFGLFTHEQWRQWLREAGFDPEYVVDSYERSVFVGRKP